MRTRSFLIGLDEYQGHLSPDWKPDSGIGSSQPRSPVPVSTRLFKSFLIGLDEYQGHHFD
jgi:hypothetical protein